MRRRRRHIQGNFAANCVRGALATSARFATKFCRRGFQRAAEPSTACGGYSEAEQGQRSQSASAIYGAPRDAGTATRRNSRVRQLPCAAVAPFAACRGTRHAARARRSAGRTVAYYTSLCRACPAPRRKKGQIFVSVIDCTEKSGKSDSLRIKGELYISKMASLLDCYVRDGFSIVLVSFCRAEGDEDAILRILEHK